MRWGTQMKNYEKIIEKHFEAFMESNKKYSEVRILHQKWFLRLDYHIHFIDEEDITGFIYYKPTLGKYARLYMFKGKPFERKKCPRSGIRRLKIRFKNRFRLPDRQKRNKAEWRVFFHILFDGLKYAVVGGIPLVVFILNFKK